MSSLFTKIIKGEIPCYKVYEDEYTLAFLDIFPLERGHTLIVPKTEIDYFVDVPEPYYSAVFNTAKKLAPAIQKAVGVDRIATSIVGVDVPHFHYHLVPIVNNNNPLKNTPLKIKDKELKEIQEKIVAEL